jgi:hypothetical protein
MKNVFLKVATAFNLTEIHRFSSETSANFYVHDFTLKLTTIFTNKHKTNFVALIPQASYTDRAADIGRRS